MFTNCLVLFIIHTHHPHPIASRKHQPATPRSLVIGSGHGYQIWPQSGSDWPQMGQIREIFRSDSVHFGAPVMVGPKVIQIGKSGTFSDQISVHFGALLKSPRFVPFGDNLPQSRANPDNPVT